MDSVLLGFSGGAFTSSAVPCELELGAGSASPLYRTAPRRQSSHELGSRSDKKKVLVVDDVPFNRLILGKMLSGLGYEVIYGQNGVEAVNFYSQHAEALLCVLMDIQMPMMDGLEATQKIRKLEATPSRSCSSSSSLSSEDSPGFSPSTPTSSASSRRVPIVGVSASSEAEQLSSPALAGVATSASGPPWEVVGMDGFMAKPVKQDALRLTLEQLEQLRSGGIPPEPQPGTAPSCTLSTALSRQLEVARNSALPAVLVEECPGGQQVAKCCLGGSLASAPSFVPRSLPGGMPSPPSSLADAPASAKRKRDFSAQRPAQLHPIVRLGSTGICSTPPCASASPPPPL